MDSEAVNVKKLQSHLEKVTGKSEIYQRKNAELEKVNDQLRLENTELLQKVDLLREHVVTLQEKLSSLEIKKQPALEKAQSLDLDKLESEPHKKDTLYEVKTLRKVKRELEKQLHASKSTTLSFQASFQAEFDLRSQIEQKLEELRERYERLVTENDQLRMILKAHKISAPSPPGLRSLPGSRKKKHAPNMSRARPMTMYSDLSSYGDRKSPVKSSLNNSNGHSKKSESALSKKKKSSSMRSLDEKSSNVDSQVSSLSQSRVKSQVVDTLEGSTAIIMADTAQTVDQTSPLLNHTSSSPEADTSAADHNGHTDTTKITATDSTNITHSPPSDVPHSQDAANESVHPAVFSKTDTIMWNAKGFLSRIERISDSDGTKEEARDGDGKEETEVKEQATNREESPIHKEPEKEMKEAMSVSSKQLESAKAFYAQLQKKTTDNDTTS